MTAVATTKGMKVIAKPIKKIAVVAITSGEANTNARRPSVLVISRAIPNSAPAAEPMMALRTRYRGIAMLNNCRRSVGFLTLAVRQGRALGDCGYSLFLAEVS